MNDQSKSGGGTPQPQTSYLNINTQILFKGKVYACSHKVSQLIVEIAGLDLSMSIAMESIEERLREAIKSDS